MNRILVAALVAISLISPTAHAAPRPSTSASPPAAPTVAEQNHYEVGKRLFALKHYAAALEEFRLEMSIAPRPEVLYSMAQTQRLLGDCASAIETYRAFLAGQPEEPFAQYARLNIERCEARGTSPEPPELPAPVETDAWYRDTAGHALVGGGIVAGVIGTLVWRSGRADANRLADAPDYQSFVDRRAASSSAVTRQWLGGGAMIAGGVAILGGIAHYVHHRRASRHAASLGVAVTPDGAIVTGRAAF